MGQVTGMGNEVKYTYRGFWRDNLKKSCDLEGLAADRTIILKWTLRNCLEECKLDLSDLV
jgi:hypothetical protein